MFTNTSANSNAWLWNFGDGTSSNEQNPTHVYTSVGTYTITLTAYNYNCTTSVIGSVIVVESSVGVDEINADYYLLQVYPNPNDGRFTLQIEDCSGCLENIELLMIVNTLGETVYQRSNIKTSSLTVDLSNQPQGIYFVKMILPASEIAVANATQLLEQVIVKKIIIN